MVDMNELAARCSCNVGSAAAGRQEAGRMTFSNRRRPVGVTMHAFGLQWKGGTRCRQALGLTNAGFTSR
jgi:hypothetical protein